MQGNTIICLNCFSDSLAYMFEKYQIISALKIITHKLSVISCASCSILTLKAKIWPILALFNFKTGTILGKWDHLRDGLFQLDPFLFPTWGWLLISLLRSPGTLWNLCGCFLSFYSRYSSVFFLKVQTCSSC